MTFSFTDNANRAKLRPVAVAASPPPELTSSDRLDDHVPLSAEGIAYLAGRGIPQAVAEAYGVVSGRRRFAPQRGLPGGTMEAIGFRYTNDGKPYAIKWRSIHEKFFVADGGPATLWGPTILPGETLVLCEGEVDAMSLFAASGLKAKSIPSGASVGASSVTKMAFLDHSYADIKNAAEVVLFLDADLPGRAMGQELARRIGRAKCWTVKLPSGIKDANQLLMEQGAEALAAVLAAREPWPVEGLARPSDYRAEVRKLHHDGMPRGFSTGLRCMDELLTVMPGMLYIVTGRPGGGKTTWLNGVMVSLSERLGWRWAVASFESPPALHISRLAGLRTRMAFRSIGEADVDNAVDWVDEHFCLLTGDGLSDIESILERGKVAVTRYGVRGFTIDPWNFIIESGREVNTEYCNEVLAKLKTFAVAHDVAVFLVAHPAKPGMMVADDWMPGGYGVAGSAHFFNRADMGITIGRATGAEELQGEAKAMIWKSRWSHLGREGSVIMQFDQAVECFKDRPTPVGYENSVKSPWEV